MSYIVHCIVCDMRIHTDNKAEADEEKAIHDKMLSHSTNGTGSVQHHCVIIEVLP